MKISVLGVALCLLLIGSAISQAASPPTVLITGANRGLGLAFTQKYVARGWNVIAAVRNPAEAIALQELAKRRDGVRIEQVDVTDPASVDALGKRLGNTPIDILLNNVGMLGSEPEQQLGTLDASRFDTYMRVNALGALLVSERLLPNVRAGKQKKIAGISAVVASFAAYPRIHPGLYYYKASKAALNMLMRNLALDTERDGITVVVLSPGVVNTNGTKMSPDMPGMVDIDTSVDGMMKVLDGLELKGSGKWYRYNGDVIAW